MNPMSGFDIISAAGNGYVTVWREREWLLRLAAPVLFVKILCMGAISVLGLDQNFVRQAVIMLPSFFIEGWLCVHLVRLIVFGERWTALQDSQNIRAGMLVFVLMKFVLSGLAALVSISGHAEDITAARNPAPALASFLPAILVFAATIWSFRYLWLYIPMAVGQPIRDFLRMLGGFMISLNLIGAWLIGFVPFILVLGVVSGILIPPETPSLSVPVTALLLLIQAAIDTATTLVTTAAITHGFCEMAQKKDAK